MQQFRPWRYRPVFPGAVYPVDRIARYTRGVTTFNIEDWTPALGLEGYDPLLWLRADQGVSTGGARQFYSADKTSLQHTDNAFFSTGDIDFLWAGWVYHTTLSSFQNILHKSAVTTEYDAEVSAAGTVYWGVGSKQAFIASALTAGKWHFLVFYHDSAANTIGLSVDNGAFTTLAMDAVVPADTTGNFLMGVYSAGTSQWLNGKLSRWCFLKNSAARAVIDSAATRTEMYNLGRGILSGNLDLLLADLGTFTAGTDWDAWNLNETDGTADARSFSGLNDLTPTFGELITNGGFETAGAGGADVFGSWTEATFGTGAIADEAVIVDAGSHAAKMTAVDASNYCDLVQAVLTSGHRYTASCRARNSGSGQGKMFIGLYGTQLTIGSTSSFATYSITDTATSANLYLELYNVNCSIYIDTVSVKALDIPACDGPSSDIAPDTGSAGTAHGQLIGFADSETARSTDVPSAIGSGTSLVLDGVNDYVRLPANIAVTGDFSYSLWFNATALGTSNFTLFGDLLDINVSVYTPNSTTWYYRSNAGALRTFTVPAMSDSTWYHMFVTRDAGTVHLYLNNVESSTGGITDAGNMPLGMIGTRADGAIPWRGKIDDFRLYNGVVLSSGQRTEIYTGSEATGATPTAHWTFDEETSLSVTDGDPIATWTSLEGSRHQFIQATASKRPVYRASAINGQAGIDFDGVDDLLVKASAFLTGTSGTVVVVYRLDSVPNSYQMLIGSADESSATRFIEIIARGNTANPHAFYSQQNADTNDALDGDTTVNVDTDYVSKFGSNGTAINARLNGTVQTLNADSGANNGDWWDDTTAKDNVTLGGLKYNGTEADRLYGKICEIQVWPHNFGAESISKVAAYILARYGITF